MTSDNWNSLYDLCAGQSIITMSRFSSPVEEFYSAFEDKDSPFLYYYMFQNRKTKKRVLTRGEFRNLANAAAAYLAELGFKKGDRIIHAFSDNSPYDLVFRFASVITGCVPVTINWQADDNKQVLYKARVTNALMIIYDKGFASRIEEIKQQTDSMLFLEAEMVEEFHVSSQFSCQPITYDDERMIVFTSGTTGKPKGVSLSHRSYLANRLTFERYFTLSEASGLNLFLVNPLHHSNSSALSDWGLRRKGAVIHLLQHYTTAYWKILVEAVRNMRGRLIAPVVSRHFDFLQNLSNESRLPVEEESIKKALRKADILIGSAPVGPMTINRILEFCGRLPHVRFGSTETCLQVMATPNSLSEEDLMNAFKAGWSHKRQGRDITGYYIGREHSPFTRVKVVKAIDPEETDYFRPCEIGEPGYIITQGPNVMSYYTGDDEATNAVFRQGWYTGLKDVVFALRNNKDGCLDYYWTSRESELLIRGGANYAYDQISAELNSFLVEQFHIQPEKFQMAIVGLRLGSEHEDSCCVTIELSEEASGVQKLLNTDFIEKANNIVSKGARPDYVRFAQIPHNFKGAVLYPQLKKEFTDWLSQKKK